MKRATAVLLMLVLVLPAASISSDDVDVLRVLVAGDSLARGLYSSVSYVDLLERYYRLEERDVQIEVFSVCTIRGLVQAWTDVEQFAPDVLIIELGINDLRDGASTEHCPLTDDIDHFQRAYGYRLHLASEAGYTVVAITIPWSGWASGSAFYQKALDYNERIQTTAQAHGALMADAWQVTHLREDGLSGIDGLHPNDAGHQRLADAIYKVLRDRD